MNRRMTSGQHPVDKSETQYARAIPTPLSTSSTTSSLISDRYRARSHFESPSPLMRFNIMRSNSSLDGTFVPNALHPISRRLSETLMSLIFRADCSISNQDGWYRKALEDDSSESSTAFCRSARALCPPPNDTASPTDNKASTKEAFSSSHELKRASAFFNAFLASTTAVCASPCSASRSFRAKIACSRIPSRNTSFARPSSLARACTTCRWESIALRSPSTPLYARAVALI
mmetsp:Transcript_4687/g.13412  ORF Transcript_4687/g.13412 Transcript_4687/m.13412 type:complete len:232 (-) Transcript_4687:534-1229(-)